METRTDIHRPAVIIPEDYTFVAFDYIGGSDLGAILMMKVEREKFRAHMDSTGGRFSSHEHQSLTGFKVWGNIFMNAKKGDLVTFTATIEPSKDDPKFGFYKRAAKASFVKEDTGEIIPPYPMGYETAQFPTPESLHAAQTKWCESYGEVR